MTPHDQRLNPLRLPAGIPEFDARKFLTMFHRSRKEENLYREPAEHVSMRRAHGEAVLAKLREG